ncbi:hypothetical protein [Micromonospora sp. NPDC050495]
MFGEDTGPPHVDFYTLAHRLRSEYENIDDEALWQKEGERRYAAAR